jgi:hypothetical protein
VRILLDECVPRLLKRDIVGHDVVTVVEAGWAGIKNGDLLDVAEGSFDVLLTVDRSMEHQQNLRGRNITVDVLVASSNRLPALRPLVPTLLEALDTVQPGEVVRIAPQTA